MYDYTYYPENYDWLDKDTQKKILQIVNEASDKYNFYFWKWIRNQTDDETHSLMKEAKKTLWRYLRCAENMGIFIRFNWVGHRGERFLATIQDRDFQDIFEEDMRMEH